MWANRGGQVHAAPCALARAPVLQWQVLLKVLYINLFFYGKTNSSPVGPVGTTSNVSALVYLLYRTHDAETHSSLAWGRSFSKVLYLRVSYSTHTRALTFENFYFL